MKIIYPIIFSAFEFKKLSIIFICVNLHFKSPWHKLLWKKNTGTIDTARTDKIWKINILSETSKIIQFQLKSLKVDILSLEVGWSSSIMKVVERKKSSLKAQTRINQSRCRCPKSSLSIRLLYGFSLQTQELLHNEVADPQLLYVVPCYGPRGS